MESQSEQHAAAGADHGAFRRAIERHDLPAVLATLAPDVVFHSPIVHRPSVGRDAIAPVLAAVLEVFRDFRYVAEYSAPDGRALVFQAQVADRDLEGIDLITFNADGLVSEFTVLVRPYSAATALRDAMAARLAAQ